jgi:hypothetical protein
VVRRESAGNSVDANRWAKYVRLVACAPPDLLFSLELLAQRLYRHAD